MLIYDLDEEMEEEPFPDEYDTGEIIEEEAVTGTETEITGDRGSTTPIEPVKSVEGTVTIFETTAQKEEVVTDKAEVVTTARRTDSVEYPMLLLESDTIAQHKLIALQSIINSKGKLASASSYTVYLKSGGKVVRIGMTTNFALRAILSSDVFKDFKKFVKLSADRKIEGNLLYALCGVNV